MNLLKWTSSWWLGYCANDEEGDKDGADDDVNNDDNDGRY